jgi:hypothetical protein
MPELLEAKVDFGMAWLKANISDWRSWINVEKLDIRRHECCILGQLSKHPNLRFPEHVVSGLGFSERAGLLCKEEDDETRNAIYEELTGIWKRKINEYDRNLTRAN